MSLQNTFEGWTKSLGLAQVSDADKQLALARVKICVGCEFAEENWLSKIVNGALQKDELGSGIGCSICGCPVNQKALVKSETCPKGFW